ncbi:vacuolar protein sorting-associated protein 37A isoform X2 [Zootermopsis nevadensis]|uniref:Vacuolar protein sorting-associated protein 37A n=1 Tax=Zootermopsis nevadensis TaxID=136037 RepID=A0A067QPU8_ZOONE|nr:vacuolar protein sorting-associated protein 37A isoform X2 [Zootermopsis nevadensis]KDR10569.1 Vacuolar protein sorting-associated protein 37A [Zootermopsis nevadensis]
MLSRIFRETENAAVNRKRQIDTLKIFNDHVTEIQEDVEYRVEFSAGGHGMTIQVSLPPEFPLEKPVLKVSPQIDHPWVNEQCKVVSAPGLLNFTVHSDLGRVVQAIIREFERRPPPLVGDAGGGTSTTHHTGQESCTSGRTSPPYMMLAFAQQQQQRVLSFPELLDLSAAELEHLSQSEDRLDEFIDKLPPVLKLNNAVEDMISKNEELAKENLTKEPQLEKLRYGVQDKLEALAILKDSYESLSQEYQRLSDKYAPSSIKESLRLAALHSDEESEQIAEQFLSGKISVEQFVSMYLQKRTLSQTRKTKEEKLGSQLKELERAGY